MPPARSPLTKARVIDAAVALADEGGLEAVSMRAVAAELGVTAMSLYNHVKGKDELLEGMLDSVISEIELPDGVDWKAAIRASSISSLDVLLRHGWACGLWLSKQSDGSSRLRHGDWLLRRLGEGNLTDEVVFHAYHILESYVLGSTLQRLSFNFQGQELADMANDFLKTFPAADYPDMVKHIRQHLDPSAVTQSGFEFALDLILDGLERARDNV